MQQSAPWRVFFDSWHLSTHHLPRISAIPVGGERAPAFLAADEARRRVLHFQSAVLGWPKDLARRLSMHFALDVVIWAQLDGIDRGALKERLRRTEDKFLAKEQLGLPGWAVTMGQQASGAVTLRTAELPEAFYQAVVQGSEILRRPPWEGASDYVSDGRRYGVRFQSGAVRWFEAPEDRLLEELRDDFRGIDVFDVVEGLKDYLTRKGELSLPLATDVARLEAVLQEGHRG